MERQILHSDGNNFYASIECLHNPEIRNKPVAVGGSVELRHGIVLAKNYIAKRFGVQTGEPLWSARRKCPDIVFVPPDFEKYLRFSRMANEIYSEYSDRVEAFGIDESWIDATNAAEEYGGGQAVADVIRERIKSELGITVSVGVSFNKVFAKLASDMEKPDKTIVIPKERFKEKVWPLPVNDLLYVGRATHKKLLMFGLRTIGDLARADADMLAQNLGKNGRMLWAFANGLDTSPVSKTSAKALIKSVGNSTTAPRDLTTDNDVRITLCVLAESVAERLRDYKLKCGTVQISIRDNELFSYERQGKLQAPSCTAKEIFEKAFELFDKNRPSKPIRSLGVRGCNLESDENKQLTIFTSKAQKTEDLERTVDDIRRRFGHFKIQRGLLLTDTTLSNLDPRSDHVIHPVGFLSGG